jgi:hypothetical protein
MVEVQTGLGVAGLVLLNFPTVQQQEKQQEKYFNVNR